MRHEWKDIDGDGNETHWTAEGDVLLVGGTQILEGGGPAAREILRLAEENRKLLAGQFPEVAERIQALTEENARLTQVMLETIHEAERIAALKELVAAIDRMAKIVRSLDPVG